MVEVSCAKANYRLQTSETVFLRGFQLTNSFDFHRRCPKYQTEK